MGKKLVVGFLIRSLSDIIDYFILGIFGYLLSIPLKEFFCLIGESAVLFGVIISFLYFGILQSATTGGQTLGNMLLRIQVLRMDGTYLSKSRSFLRFIIPAFLLFNQSLLIGITSLFPGLDNVFFGSTYSFLVMALLAGVSFCVAVHPLKRGIHDLLADSIVVKENAYHKDTLTVLNTPSRERRAFVLTGLSLILLAAGNFLEIKSAEPMRPAIELLQHQKKILEENTRLQRVVPRLIFGSVPQPDGSRKEVMVLKLEASLIKSIFEDEHFRRQEVREAVSLLVNNYPQVSQCSYLDVSITTGYNIGIWYFYQKSKYSFGPDGKEIDAK